MASTYQELWSNLEAGVDATTRDDRDSEDRVGDTWVSAEGLLSDVEHFDASRFRIPPAEAQLLDPQQRLFMEVAYDALADAGHEAGAGLESVGVVAGVGENRYLLDNLLRNPEIERDRGALAVLLASEKDHVATRLAYRLGLTGPALNIQTSCSTSLVAVHVGVSMLRAGDADSVIVGGSSVRLPGRVGYRYETDGILSPDGICRAFDAEAQGTVPGSGAVALVLRRLDDAIRSRDPIHAVIKGSAINNDGAAKIGYTAPSAEGQRRVIASALADAGVDPAEVDYVVTHGTGTPLGDAIELEALGAAYRPLGAADPLVIGSVKPSVGHLDTAAGALNALVGALALSNSQIPASLHYRKPNPSLGQFGIEVASTSRPFTGDARLVGVSAFGIGGTNAHIILAPAPARSNRVKIDQTVILPATGRSEEGAKRHAHAVGRHLASSSAAGVAFTLREGRVHHEWRSFALVDPEQHDAPDFAPPRQITRNVRFGLLFPGHGKQLPGALGALATLDDHVSARFDELREHVPITYRESLTEFLFDGAAHPRSFVEEQLAIFALQYCLTGSLVRRLGQPPQVAIGHSIGEYAAATYAGVLKLRDAARLVVARATALGAIDTGAMLSVRMPMDDLRRILPDTLDLAAENGPDDGVVSGHRPDVEAFQARLLGIGIDSRLLPIGSAAHSRLLDPYLEGLEHEIASVPRRRPHATWISTATGDRVLSEVGGEYWLTQLRDPVLLATALRNTDTRRVVFVEMGVGMSMTRALASVHPDALCVPLLPSRDPELAQTELLEAFCELWQAGGAPSLLGEGPGQMLHLPSPPDERIAHWVGAPSRAAGPTTLRESAPESTDVCDARSATVPEAVIEAESMGIRRGMEGLWTSLLGVEPASGAANFFVLGGESALLVQLVQRIAESWGCRLRVKDVARAATLDNMTALVESQVSAQAAEETASTDT